MKEFLCQYTPQSVTKLKEAISTEITKMDSIVKKAVIDSIKKIALDCQSGGNP